MFLIELHWFEKWVLFEPKNNAEESIEACIDRAKGLLNPVTGCLFVYLHNKICQFNSSSLFTAKSPQTCLSLHFEDDCYPFVHQVYWRFKTKYNNYQNLWNYKWEKGVQKQAHRSSMRRQFFREWPKRYAGLPEAECLNNSRKLSSFEHLLIPSQIISLCFRGSTFHFASGVLKVAWAYCGF